jgi:hypothetical protein
MTYSLVAFDPATGECGVAVQSHWFSVGSLVTWGAPGAGVVATQANVEIAYGPRGVARMQEGASAPEALVELLAADELAAVRQVAMADAHGGVGAHTGADCMDFCGQQLEHHHSTQGNLMATDRVWGEMSAAYEAGEGSLAERLLDALDAGEAAGGDVRGRQSAAILVHPEPLVELRRLVALKAAYVVTAEGDEFQARGEHEAAAAKYIEAWEMATDCEELTFWASLSLIRLGDVARGEPLLRRAVAAHPGWTQLLGMLDEDEAPGVPAARRLLGI